MMGKGRAHEVIFTKNLQHAGDCARSQGTIVNRKEPVLPLFPTVQCEETRAFMKELKQPAAGCKKKEGRKGGRERGRKEGRKGGRKEGRKETARRVNKGVDLVLEVGEHSLKR
jgi:hypothetical protein